MACQNERDEWCGSKTGRMDEERNRKKRGRFENIKKKELWCQTQCKG